MTPLVERGARRLGPLVLYEGAVGPYGRRAFYGFLAGFPARELVVQIEQNTEPTDEWFRVGDERVDGVALGWRFAARPAPRGVYLADLVTGDLSHEERETLAFAALSCARLEDWRPPEWQPHLENVFFTFEGDVKNSWCTTPADLARGNPRWLPGLARHGVAAALSACLVGEGAYDAALDAARKLSDGSTSAISDRSERAALLVEMIAVLLRPGSPKGPHLVPALRKKFPGRAEVARVVAAGAPEPLARAVAWDRARSAFASDDLTALPALDAAPPLKAADCFRVCNSYVTYGARSGSGESSRAFPIEGPFRDLVVLPFTDALSNRNEMALRGLVDPWGNPWEIDESPTLLTAARPAAPFELRPRTARERVVAALLALRALSLATPLRTPSWRQLTVTFDGQVCADGFEPGFAGVDWRGSAVDWRDKWAIEVMIVALGNDAENVVKRAEQALGEIEDGVEVEICGDATLDEKLRAAVSALTSDRPWQETCETIARIAVGVGPVAAPNDPEAAARINYVERERQRIVAELGAEPPRDRRIDPPSSAVARFADALRDAGSIIVDAIRGPHT